MKKIIRSVRSYIFSLIEIIYWRSLTTKLLIDEPQGEYQPFPFQKNTSRSLRADATIDRWESMWNNLDDQPIASVKDVGCCMGYFCHAAAGLGCFAFGFDRNLKFITICNFVSNRLGFNKKQSFSLFDATPQTIQYLPKTDVTILLSVWHHWYFEYGASAAKVMLEELISSTRTVMFFESGEEEIWEEFKFPDLKDGQSSSDWIESFLKELSGVKVERISNSATASYAHYNKTVQRTLFAITHI